MRPPSRISHELVEPLAALAEQVGLGNGAVLEGELARVGGAPAELVHRRRDRRSRASRSGRSRSRSRPSPVRAVIVTHAVMSVPAFVMNILEPLTTQLPSRARRGCASRPRRSRRSGSVSPKAASFAPDASSGQPLALLLLRAVEEDRHRPERGVRGDRDRDRRVDARQLLDRDRVRHGVRARRRRTPRRSGSPSARARPAQRRARTGSGSSRSSSSATGATRTTANARTVCRISSCSCAQVVVHAGRPCSASGARRAGAAGDR